MIPKIIGNALHFKEIGKIGMELIPPTTREKAKKEALNMPEQIDGCEENDFYPEMIDDLPEDIEAKLETNLHSYFDDLKTKSEFPETIPEQPFQASDLEKISPEELAEKREEFNSIKGDLKQQWEKAHHSPWPTYESNVYSESGKLIRQAGQDYDAHHIQPLNMGGKNEAGNITPLHAEAHYDKQGIHAPDSPYEHLKQQLET